MLHMASGKGEGYIAQELGIADCLAAVYFHELRYDAASPDWADRDRFVLSTGHYAIAMYAVLAEAGYLDAADLPSYGLNGSRLPMSRFYDIPGVEMAGGSLGHGLGQAVGMAIGRKLDGRPSRVFCHFSDGELQESFTRAPTMGEATMVGNVQLRQPCGADRLQWHSGRWPGDGADRACRRQIHRLWLGFRQGERQ